MQGMWLLIFLLYGIRNKRRYETLPHSLQKGLEAKQIRIKKIEGSNQREESKRRDEQITSHTLTHGVAYLESEHSNSRLCDKKTKGNKRY